jgi:hypothetical protein
MSTDDEMPTTERKIIDSDSPDHVLNKFGTLFYHKISLIFRAMESLHFGHFYFGFICLVLFWSNDDGERFQCRGCL